MEGEIPTYRLYVYHQRPLTSKRDVEDVCSAFEHFGRVEHFVSRSRWKHAFVTFSHSTDAAQAKKSLNGSRVSGYLLKVYFTRPSRVVCIKGGCSKMDVENAFPQVERVISQKECATKGGRNVQAIEVIDGRQ